MNMEQIQPEGKIRIFSPYLHEGGMPLVDRVAQIKGLALIGIATRDSSYSVRDLEAAQQSLFEVIARLASEIEDEVEQ